MVQKTILKFTKKFTQPGKGIISNSVTGIGADKLMRIVDNVFGSPVQSIFSFNLPVIGNVGPIDFLNYIGHANGFRISKKGITAVVAAKFAGGILPSIGPITLPGGSVGQSAPVGTNTQGAPV